MLTRNPAETLGGFSRDEARSLFREFLPDAARKSAGVILAVSGGPDSIAMTRLFAWVRHEFVSHDAIVASVDHGLRPESAAEVAAVAQWSRDCGLEFRALHWRGAKPETGLQAAAREARYALLTELARETGASHLLTAHTLDDQAETILLRLVRGSGPAGLQGMSREARRCGITHLRPLLDVPKARLTAFCEACHAPYFSDPSNTDSKFTRARLRKIMAALAPEGLTAGRLATLGERLRLSESALDHAAARALAAASAESPHAYSHEAFRAEPREIRRRMIGLALDRLNAPAGSNRRLERLESLAARLGEALPRAGKPRRFTIAGAELTLTTKGVLAFAPEKPRRRGR